jgi:alpha-glucosidase
LEPLFKPNELNRRRALQTVMALPLAKGSIAAQGDGTNAENLEVTSPDTNIRVVFSLRDRGGRTSVASYSVSFKGRELIRRSSLQLQLAPHGLLGPLRTVEVVHGTSDEVYKLNPGKTSSARDHCREMRVTVEEDHEPKRRLDIVFRAYDDGVAFRYVIPEQTALPDLQLAAEHSTFACSGNPRMYVLPLPSFTTPYEARYRTLRLDEISTDALLAAPLLIEYGDGAWAAITEADLNDYAGMYLSGTPEGFLTTRLSVRPDDPQLKVKASLPHASPWRVVMIADDPGRLIESNIITSLNPPCTWTDTSWIKPGKTTFPWWNGYELGNKAGFPGAQDTRTHKYYIDFCAESGIPYHSLDGFDNIAWYGGFIVPYQGADITKSLPVIDMPELLSYAKQKGVRLRLWMNSAAARAQMQHAFPIYETWGIEGVMVDFFERDDQDMVNFVHDLLQLAARHHLTVTLHNISKPTGLHRTYPNLMTIESVFNTEYNKWDARGSTPDHELTVPFVRMLAGPLDYHCGSFHNVPPHKFVTRNIAPVTMGTRAHELARYVVYEDYLPMTVDYPDAYRNQPGFEFLVQVPTTWDETKVLNGQIGSYLTIARRHGTRWYIGSMAGIDAQTLTIPLNFIGPGDYVAEIWSDDLTMLEDATRVLRHKRNVNAADRLEAKLAPAGGHVIRLSRQS